MAEACPRCGAPFSEDAPLYCRSCGAKLAQGVADAARYRTSPERYEIVTKQPAYARALGWRPRVRPGVEIAVPVAMLVFACGFAAVFHLLIGVIKPPSEFRIGLYVVLALAVVGGVWEIAKAVRRLAAPTVASVQVVMDDRRPDNDVLAPHAVTLRGKDGREARVRSGGALMSTVLVGDIGLAYVQHDRLVDYRWFDVMPQELPEGALPHPPSCAACAAPVTIDARRDCAFCGAALAEPDLGEHGARFAAAEASPAMREAMTRGWGGGLPSWASAIVLIALGGVPLYWLLVRLEMFLYVFGASPYMLIAFAPPAVLLAIGAILLSRRIREHRAPKLRTLAVIPRKRDVLFASVNGRPWKYDHFITLQTPSGGRKELRVLPHVARRVKQGDVGVAGVRGEWLADFTPL